MPASAFVCSRRSGWSLSNGRRRKPAETTSLSVVGGALRLCVLQFGYEHHGDLARFREREPKAGNLHGSRMHAYPRKYLAGSRHDSVRRSKGLRTMSISAEALILWTHPTQMRAARQQSPMQPTAAYARLVVRATTSEGSIIVPRTKGLRCSNAARHLILLWFWREAL